MRIACAVLLLSVSAGAALAQRAPVIVVPGKPGVPVLMHGVDVSWSVIEGEFGLDRPNAVTETVIYRPFVVPILYDAPGSYLPGYFPSTGKRPGYGRLEVVPPPNRPLPRPAPTYYRSWSSESAPGFATDYGYGTSPPDGGGYARTGHRQRHQRLSPQGSNGDHSGGHGESRR